MPTDSLTIDIIASISAQKLIAGVWTTTASGTRVVGRETNTRVYISARRRPPGFVAPKAYRRTVYGGGANIGCAPFFASGESNGVYSIQTGCSLSAANGKIAVPSFDGGLANRAIVAAKIKLKAQDVNLAVAFAERKQTADLVASNLTRIAKAYRDTRRGNFASAASHLGINLPWKSKKRGGRSPKNGKDMHNAWLELQYGWKPLLSDVYGAAETLRKKDRKDSTRYGCTVKSRKTSSDIQVARRNNVSDSNHPLTLNCRSQTEFGAFVRLDYYRGSPALAALAQTGFTNPAEVAWELIPFSFVVDWVAPIGQFLTVLDAELGWTFRAGSLSTRQVTKQRGWCEPRQISGWSKLSVSGAFYYYFKDVIRTPYVSSPVPAFYFKNPASGLHVANAIALLAQAVK